MLKVGAAGHPGWDAGALAGAMLRCKAGKKGGKHMAGQQVKSPLISRAGGAADMGLFDLFRRSAPQPRPQPVPATGYRRFERDPARMFDPAKAATLARLFAVPREGRDAEWVTRFWEAAWTAALVVPEPPVVLGPDGFPYLRLNLPPDGAGFDANSLMNVAPGMVEQGVGAAFFASAGADVAASEFVVSMGVLDSILRFDNPDGEPTELEESDPGSTGPGPMTLQAGEQILVGSPSAEYLSPPAARALHRHLAEDWGLADPRVAILVAASMRPSRSLVIGRSRSALLAAGATDEQIAGWMQRIGWFLPPSRGLMLMPDDWDVASMTPLRELF